MKRLIWLGVGLAIGGLVVHRVSRAARSYTPRGMAAGVRDSGRNLLDTVREFVDDVRDGMRERERELQAAFLDGALLPEWDDWAPDQMDGPAGDRPHRSPSQPPEATA